MYLKQLLILLTLFSMCGHALSQDAGSTTTDKITNFPSRFFSSINSKVASLDSKLEKQTEKYLQRLAKKERKLKRKLSRIDSNAANNLFNNSEQEYKQLADKLSSPEGARGGQYLPYVDSMKTSLSFLQQNSGLISNTKDIQQKIQGSLDGVTQLQSKLQQSEQVKAFIRQRKEQIKQALSKYTNLPKSITNSYNDFSKELYYYSEQVREYREMLNNPDQLVKRALTLLNRVNAFQRFMQEHSELAGLFGVPANYGTPASLAGLQTRSQVQQLIQTQLSSAGPNAQQMLQQNLQAAQAQLGQLKEKINKWGSSGGDVDMPNFKPNNQKTKSFFQRLEYGTNLQTTKSNYFWPTTSDLGLSVGYKLSDKSTIGIGASYKVGWGRDIRNIVVTNEGVGFRSFADMKLKGSFYASGGFEYNYQQPFGSIQSISALNKWQQSGLVGVSKVISIKSKFFKKTKLQLLWDFLSYEQVPRTQALKFRVGYNF
jgi:hypothetical protein